MSLTVLMINEHVCVLNVAKITYNLPKKKNIVGDSTLFVYSCVYNPVSNSMAYPLAQQN